MKSWIIILLLVFGAFILLKSKGTSIAASSNTLPVSPDTTINGQDLANKIISDVQGQIPNGQTLANDIINQVNSDVSNVNTSNATSTGGSTSVICQNGVCHTFHGSHNSYCVNGVCHSDMALEGIARS